MATLSQDIQSIRSLRKNIRNPKLHPTILKSIETIQNCIMSGTDQNGWKKVDWRSNSSHRSSSSSSSSSSKPNFFSSRPSSHSSSHSSSHNAFSNRPKNHYQSRDPPISIPLTNTLPDKSTSSSNESDDSFEIVRHGRRSHYDHSSDYSSKSTEHFRSTPPPKYVSKFKRSAKVEDTILNTILLGKLNKFSPSNYNEIKEFIIQIISDGQTDMIKCFMKLVFEKAASEEIYCPLYAKLLSELSSHYPVLLTEMTNLYSQYMRIFEEVSDGTNENYNEMCQRNIEKKYRRGYSQFLAELIKHNIIDTDIFVKTINTIITQVELNLTNTDSVKLIEEFADCLMKIMKAIQTTSSHTDDDEKQDDTNSIHIRSVIKNQIVLRIRPLTLRNSDFIGLSNKARFTFLDIYEGINKF